MRLLRRSRAGEVYEGPLCRAMVPGHPGAWGWFATKQTKRGEEIDFDAPLTWIDDAPGDPEDVSGHWERVN